MEVLTPCTYCENFEGSVFEVGNGKTQRFNFCPVCGRPYTPEGAEMLTRRAQPEQLEQKV